MLKGGARPVESTSGESLSTSGLIVALVLALGATVYLRRAGYIRRNTTYVLVGLELLGILILAFFIRQGGFHFY